MLGEESLACVRSMNTPNSLNKESRPSLLSLLLICLAVLGDFQDSGHVRPIRDRDLQFRGVTSGFCFEFSPMGFKFFYRLSFLKGNHPKCDARFRGVEKA